MIDLKKLKSGRHSLAITLHFEDTNGNGATPSTEQLKVIYRGVTLQEAIESEEKLAREPGRGFLIEWCANNVLELPGLLDENGQPVKVDADFFAGLDVYYLVRINQAIQRDRLGND